MYPGSVGFWYTLLKRVNWLSLHELSEDVFLTIEPWSEDKFFGIICWGYTKCYLRVEKALEEGSVIYGEISFVTNRFGSLLLQVKDKKAGNQKITCKSKAIQAISKAQTPLVTVEQYIEKHNNCELLHYVPSLDINKTLLNNLQPSSRHFQILVNDFMPYIPFSTLAHPLCDISAQKKVQFELLPAVEISYHKFWEKQDH